MRCLAALRKGLPAAPPPSAAPPSAAPPSAAPPRSAVPAPTGLYLGAYGWVVDLRPDPEAATVTATAPDGTPVTARTDSAGFVYAPSMLHASTAAVLRSAYLARSGDDAAGYAVDLTSSRVRSALAVLDAVRGVQPLGAVLGYAFERGLHEGHPGVELDRFIDVFRGLYPVVANKIDDSGQPAGAVAARSVVDGLALLHAAQAGQVPASAADLPGSGGIPSPPSATTRPPEALPLDDRHGLAAEAPSVARADAMLRQHGIRRVDIVLAVRRHREEHSAR